MVILCNISLRYFTTYNHCSVYKLFSDPKYFTINLYIYRRIVKFFFFSQVLLKSNGNEM